MQIDDVIGLDNTVGTIAGFGVTSLILMTLMEFSDQFGGAKLTFSLKAIGPGGMLGGMATLGLIGVVTKALTEYGFDTLLYLVIKEQRKQGESDDDLIYKVKNFPVTKKLKSLLISRIREAY